MSLTQAKQSFAEIEGTRCRVIESGISRERAEFLSRLLVHNGQEVLIAPLPSGEGDGDLYVVGVKNLLFHPILAVYERKLTQPDGKRVTPAYWNQQNEQPGRGYWEYLFPTDLKDEEAFTPWEYRSV